MCCLWNKGGIHPLDTRENSSFYSAERILGHLGEGSGLAGGRSIVRISLEYGSKGGQRCS